MPHALLLSPDDQAVTAITGVLEELSVTCERPLDGATAAKKLNSQTFDLVLVDCENLPAAKLIFDVCRRGKSGNNPVPIAIVDGRAGLPTAFRLGAELILTKPVAKDQARTTIRTAVGRVRKDNSASESVSETLDISSPSSVDIADDSIAEERALAAAAASTQLTSYADPTPAFAAPAAASPVTLPAPVLVPKMNTAPEATSTALIPTLKPRPSTLAAESTSDLWESKASASLSAAPTPKAPVPLSDDPVMADLERAEMEGSAFKPLPPQDEKKQKTPVAKPEREETESADPVLSSYQEGKKPRRTLVALFALLLAAGGFYGAWMYQPGFRSLAQPQIERLFALTEKQAPVAQAPRPVQPAPQVAPTPSPAPVVTASADPVKTESNGTDSVANTAASVPGTATTTAAPAPTPAPAQSTGVPPPKITADAPVSVPKIAPAVAINPEAPVKVNVSKTAVTKKVAAPTPALDTPLPGENSAVILSSKGAEKRLAHSVPPKYPDGMKSIADDGTVVLKEIVDEDGNVQGVRLVEGNPLLASAAIQAVKQWRYRPYVRDGKAQPFQTVVIIDFQRP